MWSRPSTPVSHACSHTSWAYTPPAEALVKGMNKLMQDGNDLSDFTFVAHGGKEWKVHKVVLFMHSDVLYKMSSNENFTECKTGRAELKDVDGNLLSEECVNALVRYLYRQDLAQPWIAKHALGGRRRSSCSGWLSAAPTQGIIPDSASEIEDDDGEEEGSVAADGDQNGDWAASSAPDGDLDGWERKVIVTTVNQAANWQWPDCDNHPNHGIDFLISMAKIAEMYNIQPLKALAIAQIEKCIDCDMPSKIETVVHKICTSETVPDEMRDAVVKSTAERIGRFHALKSKVLDEQPEFAMEVFKEVIKRDYERLEREKKKEAEHRRIWGPE